MKNILKLSTIIILTCLASYATEQRLYSVETESKKPIGADFGEKIWIKFEKTRLKKDDVSRGDRRLIKHSLHRRDHEETKKTVDRLISSKIEESNDIWKQTLNLKNLELLPMNLYKDGYKYNLKKQENDDKTEIYYIIEIDPRYNLIFAAMFHEDSFSKLISNLRKLIQDVRDGKKLTGLSLITIDVTRDYLLNYIDKIFEPKWEGAPKAFANFRKSVELLKFGESEVLAMSDENLDRLIDANENDEIQTYTFHYAYKNDSYRKMFFTNSSFCEGLKAKIITFDCCSSREIRIINLLWNAMSIEERDLVSEKLGVAIGPEGAKKYIVPWNIKLGKLSIAGTDLKALQTHRNFLYIASQVKILILKSFSDIDRDLISAWLSPNLPNLQEIKINKYSGKECDFLTINNSDEGSCTIRLLYGIGLIDLSVFKLIDDKNPIKEINIDDINNIEKIGLIGASIKSVKKLQISGSKFFKVINLQADSFIVLVNFLFPNLEHLILKDLKFTENQVECNFKFSEQQLKQLNLLELKNINNKLTVITDSMQLTVVIDGKRIDR